MCLYKYNQSLLCIYMVFPPKIFHRKTLQGMFAPPRIVSVKFAPAWSTDWFEFQIPEGWDSTWVFWSFYRRCFAITWSNYFKINNEENHQGASYQYSNNADHHGSLKWRKKVHLIFEKKLCAQYQLIWFVIVFSEDVNLWY